MKENYLQKLCWSWNPYPSACHEGELPGEALRELESLSYSAFYEGELAGEALRELESLS